MSPYRLPAPPEFHDCPSEDAGHECLCYEPMPVFIEALSQRPRPEPSRVRRWLAAFFGRKKP